MPSPRRGGGIGVDNLRIFNLNNKPLKQKAEARKQKII
jgi:hypothetical protein